MTENTKVLLVEDSRADARLIMEVFQEERIKVDMSIVRDGDEAVSYLHGVGDYRDALCPDLIILDLNLPKKGGLEVLAEIKADPKLQSIPVIILTTSQSEEDIHKGYKLHASCYVTKPIDLEQFLSIIKSLDKFWFSSVRFPPRQ